MNKYLTLIPLILFLWTCSENNNPSQSQNSPPVINEITVNPSQPKCGQTVILNAVATDNNSDVLSYNWSTSAGQLSGDGTGNPISWTTPETGGQISIICIVSDGKDVAIKNVTIDVIYEIGILKGYVFDGNTNVPISGMRIWIEDKREDTNSIGYYEFYDLQIGEQIISIQDIHNYGYSTYKDTITIVGGNNILDFYLYKDWGTYSGYVYIKNTTDGLNDADIRIGQGYTTSRSGGYCSMIIPVGKHRVVVSREGFITYTDSLQVLGMNISLDFYLEIE